MTMTDASLLSQRYRRAADFTDAVDRGYLSLKKEQCGYAAMANEGDAFARLANVLAALIELLTPTPVPGHLPRSDLIPDAVLSRLRSDKGVDQLLPSLRSLTVLLHSSKPAPDDRQLSALDWLARLGHAEASTTFRRLMRH